MNKKNKASEVGVSSGYTTVKQKILKNVSKPVFKKNLNPELDEVFMFIKQQLVDEDKIIDSNIELGKNNVKTPMTVNSQSSVTLKNKDVVNKAKTSKKRTYYQE